MAKLAVFLFAALAIYAAAAHKHHSYETDYDVKRFEQFNDYGFEAPLMKMKQFATDLTERYHEMTIDDSKYVKILTWQRRMLSQYIDTIVEKLESGDFYHGENVDHVFLTNFLKEFREIQVYLHRADDMDFVELKHQLVRYINKTVEQIEKFVTWFRMHYTETQGSLNYFVKSVVFDFVKVLQEFYLKFETVGFTTSTTGLHQWGVKIEDLTRDLIQSFEHIYLNNAHVKDALRKFLHHLEVFRTELKENYKHIDVEFITMFDEMYQRLYDVILPVVETTKYDRFVKVDMWKRQFVTELETICKDILRWVERYETKYQSTEYYMVFEKILKNYLYTIYNLKIDLVKDLEVREVYHTDYYGKTDLKRGLFGLDMYNKDFYNKDMYTSNMYNKQMYNKDFYNKNMYNKDFYNKDMYNKDFYNKDMYSKNLYNKDMYTKNLYNKDMHTMDIYHKNMYKDTGKGLTMQLYTVIDRLSVTLDKIFLDNVVVKDSLFHLIKVYVIELETIIEQLSEVETYHKDVFYNLRELVMSLKHILDDKYTFNSYELKNHIKLTIRNFAEELNKFTMMWQTKYEVSEDKYYLLKNIIVKFLTYTRNFEMHLLNVGQLVYTDKTYYDFETQMKILARDFILNLETIDVTDNMMIRKVLVTRCNEFALYIRSIIEKLETKFEYNTMYHDKDYKQVLFNLKEIFDTLERFVEHKDIDVDYKIKDVLIRCVQNTVTEMQKLSFFWQNFEHGKDEGFKTVIYDILRDFVYMLKNYQIKLHDVYYKSESGLGLRQLQYQITIVTNNLGAYLKNVRDVKVQDNEYVMQWIHKFTHTIEMIVERFETEVTYTDKTGVYYEVVSELKTIVQHLHKFYQYDTIKVDYQFYSELYYVLQKTATQFKKLAYFCQYDSELHGHVEEVVRSIFMNYLVVIQHLQIDLHRVNHYYHIGTTIDELKLQTEIVVERLLTLLRFDVPHITKEYTFVWHVRRINAVVERMIEQFTMKKDLFEDKYFENYMIHFNRIRMYLRKCLTNVDEITYEQFKIEFTNFVEEIKKSLWINEYQYVKQTDAVFKNLMIDFLYELQYCELYFQQTLLYVNAEQSPRDLTYQIDFVANRLTTLFKYTWPATDDVRGILVIQVGELCDTIQNLIHLLKVEIKTNGDKDNVLFNVIAELTKVYNHIYRFNAIQDDVDVHQLMRDFDMSIRNVVLVFRKLGYGIEEMKMINTNGVLNGVYNHFLVSLRNIYIQLDTYKRFGLYFHETTQLLDQIQTVTNQLTHTLGYVDLNEQALKQFFVIETLKYTHHIHNIIEKLNILIRSTKTETQTIEKIVLHLRQIIVSLQQVGTTVDTATTTVLRNWLNNKIVSVDAEIEKLLLINFTQYEDKHSIVLVRSVLIDYLATVQNLKHSIDNIVMINQKGLTVEQLVYHLEFMIQDLYYYLNYVVFTDVFVKDTLLVEFRNLDKVIETIVERIYTVIESEHNTVYLRKIVEELKEIQMIVRKYTTMEYKDINQWRINYEIVLRRTVYALRQFVFVVRPEIESHHFNLEIFDFVKSIYVDFFYYTQNCEIQFLNVLQRDYLKQYAMELTYVRHNTNILAGDYHKYDDVKFYNRYDVETSTTYQLFTEVKKMIYDLTTMFRGIHTLKNQEDLHMFYTEIRKFVYVIENMLEQLKEHALVVKGDVMVLNRIIEQLETSLYSIKRFTAHTTFTSFDNFDSFKMQLTKFFHVFVEQLEQLVSYHEEYKGTFDIVFQKMLREVLMTLRNIKYQFGYGYDKSMMYNKDYKYGYDRFDKTHKYGVYDYIMKPYVKDVDRFDISYGKMDYFNKKFDFGLNGDMYKYNKGEQSFDDLFKHINIFCDKLIKNVEIYVNEKQGKEVLVYYVRDLIKIVDTMIYKFETIVTVENKEFVYRFLQTLKLVKTDLYEIVHSDVMTGVYQIRTQYVYAIRKVCTEFVHFVRDNQYLIREHETMIYDIVHQYFVYLRNACLKMEKGQDYEFTKYNVENVQFDSMRVRQFAQDVKYIIDKLQSKIYLIKGKDLVVVRQVLLKLRQILREIYGDVSEIKYEYFRNIVQEVTYEIKNWMTVVEQYGFEHDLYVLAKDVLFDFRRACQKLYFQDKHMMNLWA